jgi:glyoxylase-like metal-dependent hydrolase (beta-lactamase superfamily II)
MKQANRSTPQWLRSMAGLAAFSAIAAFAPFLAQAQTAAPVTQAVAPQLKTQVPGYYRMQLGDFTVTALYDGFIDIDTKLLVNTTQADLQKLLARMFQQSPKVQTAVNTYLVHTGSQLVLIDTGTAKTFGPDLGFVLDNLKAAGYAPEQVSTVLLTHMHPDHANGLLTPDGKPAFPNAKVLVAKKESDFWLDAKIASAAPKDAQAFFKMANDASSPYRAGKQWQTFEGTAAVVPGITPVALPGHTPGHTGYLIESKGAKLLIWGDIIHNYASQLVNPNIAIEFDTDKKQAVATRKMIFKRAATEKLLVAGMHLPFPGIGHIRPEPRGYAWVPVEYGPIR